MKNSKICRLCLKSCKANIPFQETTKEILEVLLAKMDLDISVNPVKCIECRENLQKCFEFKSICIFNQENVIGILESKLVCNTNMTKVYLEDEKNNSNLSNMEKVCRFCTKPVTKFLTIDELDNDINFSNMVQKFLPEVKLPVTNNSVTCCNCLNSLKSYFTFLKNCEDVEEYIKAYCKAENITEGKVELYNVAQYTLKHIVFGSNAEKNIPRLMKDVFEEVTVTKNESVETYSSDPIKTEIIIKEEQLIETNSADIIDVDTTTTEEIQPLDIYSSDSASTEMFLIKGHLFKNYSSDPVKTEVVIKKEQITGKNSADSIDMDTFTTQVQLVEQLPSDPSDAKTLKKERDLPVEEIKNENIDDDDDVFSEGCSDESNTEDIEMAEMKIEDNDIASKNIDLKRMKKHQVLHSDKAKFQCPQCQKVFSNKVGMDDHLLRKHDNLCYLITTKIYFCDICAYKTTQKSHSLMHINAKHSRSEKYQCNYCLQGFLWKKCLQRHISLVHLKLKPYNCKGCERSFAEKSNLDGHIALFHQEEVDLMKTVTNKIYNCDYCSYKCVRKMAMTRHMEIHKRKKN